MVGVRQAAAEPMPKVAEVGAGLFLVGVGPKEKGGLRPGNGAAAMQEEICQQFLEARLIEAFDPFVATKQAERS